MLDSTSAMNLTLSTLIVAAPTEPCTQDEGTADQEASLFLNDVRTFFLLCWLSPAILTLHTFLLAETGPTCIINATYVGLSGRRTVTMC